jgi:hypothetical protein
LSHTSSLFCSGYFGDGVLETICLGWLRILILPISASQVTRIISLSHQHWGMNSFIYCLYSCQSFYTYGKPLNNQNGLKREFSTGEYLIILNLQVHIFCCLTQTYPENTFAFFPRSLVYLEMAHVLSTGNSSTDVVISF